MATYAQYDNLKDVQDNFLRLKCPFYQVMQGEKSRLWFNDEVDDVNEACEMLINDLKSLRKGTTAIFTIKHYSSIPKGGLKISSPEECLSTYKPERYTLDERDEYKTERLNYNSAMLEEIRAMRMELQEMKLKQAIQESESDDEIEEQTEGSMLGTILNNPKVNTLIDALIYKFIAPQPQTTQMIPRALAGMEAPQKEVTLETIIETLFNKGVTIEDLFKLSQMDETKLSFLLNMLRTQ